MTKFEKASKIVTLLRDKYNISYIDNRLDWSYWSCFQVIKPIMSIDEIIDIFDDLDIYVIITYPNGHKKMMLK